MLWRQTPGTDFSAAYEGKAVDDTGNVANLVIYVNFADTVHSHSDNSTTYGECFETQPESDRTVCGRSCES